MQFTVAKKDISNLSADCLCIGVFMNKQSNKIIDQLSDSVRRTIEGVIDSKDFEGTLGEVLFIPTYDNPVKRILLFGLGEQNLLNLTRFEKSLVKLIDKIGELNVVNISLTIFSQPLANLELLDVATLVSRKFTEKNYSLKTSAKHYNLENFDSLKSESNTLNELIIKCLCSEKQDDKLLGNSLKLGQAIGLGMNTTRFLGDLPSNICTPTYLSKFTEDLLSKSDCVSIEILQQSDLEKLQMYSFLSVSKGAVEPPKLIKIHYTPPTKSKEKPIVIVGKGVTFDTGGISLKPGAKMDEMKYDMCGAATTIGVLHFLALSQSVNREVIGIIPATENMPSGTASKPGDVVKSYSGQTIEILNTDAEGRLILADALSYAEQMYKPEAIVDIATLTGACIIALGNHRSAIMSNSNQLQQSLMESGEHCNDWCWNLPLDEEYNELLASNFADMANIGGRAAGSITAGCFLQRFIKNTDWAHLDIAGTAWLEGQKKGATGRPVPLICTWLLNSYQ